MSKSTCIPIHLPGQEVAHNCKIGEHDTIETLAILLVETGKIGDCKLEEIIFFEENSEEELPRHHPVSHYQNKRLHAHSCRHIEVTLVYVDERKTHKVRPGVTIRNLIEWAKSNFPVDKNAHYDLRKNGQEGEVLPSDAHIGSYSECDQCKVTFYLTPKQRTKG